jgi:hypothetical protein
MIEAMTYVEIYRMILTPEERAPHLPMDTRQVPFEMRQRGYLIKSANIGDMVEIKTMTQRIERGILVQVNPFFSHNFGHYVPILSEIRQTILKETEDLS